MAHPWLTPPCLPSCRVATHLRGVLVWGLLGSGCRGPHETSSAVGFLGLILEKQQGRELAGPQREGLGRAVRPKPST